MRDDERKGIESYQLELRSVLTKLKAEGMTGGDLTSKKAEYEQARLLLLISPNYQEQQQLI